VRKLVAAACRLYRDGEWEAAEDLFLGSPRERADIARTVPGGIEQALRDVDTYFTVEAPAHDEWRFGEAEGARIRCPVLFMLGSESSALYRHARDQIVAWMPQTETVVVPGASHLLHIQQPDSTARLLAEFLAGHPVAELVTEMRGRPRVVSHPSGDLDRYNATVDLLDRNLEAGRAGKVAIRSPAGEWTYADVAAEVNRAGNALRGLGVQIENRVLLAVADSLEFAATFFGAIKVGAVPVPVSATLTVEEYAHLLDDTRAKVAIASGSAVEGLRQARLGARHLQQLVTLGEPGAGEQSYAEVTRSAGTELAVADTQRDDMGFWLYSSGSGGRPKGVVHLQHAMRSSADTYGRTVLQLEETDVTFSISRLSFAYGLGGGLYLPFSAGATTVLVPEPPQPRMVLHTLRQYRPTVLFGIPTSYASILSAGTGHWKGDEFGSLRLCVSAGEPLAASLLERWRRETGVEVMEGIGSTESCHIFISNRPDDIRPGCTGTVVDGYRVRLVGEDDADVPPGQPGRLLVSGESIFAGYWRRRDLTRRTLLGEWLDTGDVCVADQDGHFSFQGRLDDMVKVSGMWVSPTEVEAALTHSGLVEEAAVVGVHDAINLVRLVAFVVPRGGDDPEELESALRQVIRQRLGGSKTPRAFQLVDELPRTSTGKLHRAALRERAQALACR
jgi:benzoate-CoA ligase